MSASDETLLPAVRDGDREETRLQFSIPTEPGSLGRERVSPYSWKNRKKYTGTHINEGEIESVYFRGYYFAVEKAESLFFHERESIFISPLRAPGPLSRAAKKHLCPSARGVVALGRYNFLRDK